MDPSKPVSARVSDPKLILPAILFLAFLLRFWGVWFGLPYLYHADEPVVVNHALAYGSGDLNPHFFNIPPLVSYLLFICYGVYYLAGRGAGMFHSPRDFEDLFFLDPSSFYWIARLAFGVLLGTLSVYLLYRLVKRFWTPGAALWAAFFLGVNFLHARDSHYVYADIPLLLVFLAGFFAIFRLSENPDAWKWHALAGCVTGLAVATKYNGVFLAVPYAWVCLRKVPWKKWPVFWGLAAFCAAVVFFLLNPYAVLDHSFFLREIAEQSRANQGRMPWSHHFQYSLVGAMGAPFLVLALAGWAVALFSRRVAAQSLAVFALGYYLVLCKWGQPWDRYVLPLVPVLCVLAADLLVSMKGKVPKIGFVLSLLAAAAVLPGALKIAQWDCLMAAKDVRTVAKDWTEATVPAGSRIALAAEFFMPRLAFSADQLREKKAALGREGFHATVKTRRLDALLARSYRPSYDLFFLSRAPESQGVLFGEPRIPFEMGALREKNVGYVMVVEPFYAEDNAFLLALRRNAERVMIFSPYQDPADMKSRDPQILTGGPFLWDDILARKSNGYPITVYRLRPHTAAAE